MRVVDLHRLPLSFSPFSPPSKGSIGFSCLNIHTPRTRPHSPLSLGFPAFRRNPHALFSVACLGHNASNQPGDAQTGPSSDEDLSDTKRSSGKDSFSSKDVLKQLKRYGISGILSYGLLNTVYYTATFLLVWLYVAPAPGRLGYVAAVKRFLKVMAMVWAGSQVTKLIRAGGALALAPVVDRGLSWFTVKFKFESRGKAFMAIIWTCLALAVILFLVVTLLWA